MRQNLLNSGEALEALSSNRNYGSTIVTLQEQFDVAAVANLKKLHQDFFNGANPATEAKDAATEFQVQGLELDWACVTWDGDLRFTGNDWSFHDFRGSKWTKISSAENRIYLRNAYRVLLTRARQGMVIFVPPGENSDHTRQVGFYDPTYNYLVSLGLPVLS